MVLRRTSLTDDLPMADWQRSRDWQVLGGALAPDGPAMLQVSQRTSPFHDGSESGWFNGQQGPEVVGRAIAGAVKAAGDAGRGLWDALPPLRRNRNDMVEANHIGADKYFHCKGNCEAAQRGANAEGGARRLSDWREVYGGLKSDPPTGQWADQDANSFGRRQGAGNPEGQCSALCSQYRPKGLPSRY